MIIIQRAARDLGVGDKIRMPEGTSFVVLTEVTKAYTEHHMERLTGQTIRVSVGWGTGYLFPDELVDVDVTVEDRLARNA